MSSRRQELEDSLSALTADVQRLKSKLNSTPTPTKQIPTNSSMSVMDKILGAADFPPPAPPSPFPLDESRISHHHTPQKKPTTTAFLSPSPLRQPPPSPSSSSTLPPKKIPTADLATTPKIKKLLSQVANQRDTAIDKIKLMQGTNAELKTKLSEMSRYKDKCEKLERELESLQSALDSSERIRESQRGERAKRASLVIEEYEAPCEMAVDDGYIHY